MIPVTNIHQLNQLIGNTTIYSIIVPIVAVAIAYMASNMFPWQGGIDRSYIKRRIAFFIIGLVGILGFWLYNDLVIMPNIRNAGFQNMYASRNLICIAINGATYIVTSIALMLIFRHSKFGSILGKEKSK